MTTYTDCEIPLIFPNVDLTSYEHILVTISQWSHELTVEPADISANRLVVSLTQEQTAKLYPNSKAEIIVNLWKNGKRTTSNKVFVEVLGNLLQRVIKYND